jgi:pentatricopeptide repeat protein
MFMKRRLLAIAANPASGLLRKPFQTAVPTYCRPHTAAGRHASAFVTQSRTLSVGRVDQGGSFEENELFAMREKAQDLVQNVPVGSFDGGKWVSEKDRLLWWASQRTTQSVQISFTLLERLIAEQSHTETSSLTAFLDSRLLDELVLNWLQVHKSSRSQRDMISPHKLVHELDNLCSLSPTLELTGKALLKILDVTSRRAKRRTSVQDAAFAETLLDRMVAMTNSDTATSSPPFQLPTVSLNWVLSAWVACARPDRAHELLRRVQDVITPSTVSYNSLLAAYAKVGNGPATEHLLNDMCRQWQLQQERDDELSTDSVDLRPDVYSWNTCISAWAKSSAPDAGARAQALLTRMNDPELLPRVLPDLRTYNTVMACWARSAQEGALEHCRELLQQMKELHASGDLEGPPDLFAYSTVIYAYAKAGRPTEAQEFFNEACIAFLDGQTDLRPSLALVNTLLEAFSRARDVQQTRALLDSIRELHEIGFLERGRDTSSYNMMLTTLLQCHGDVPNAAFEADNLLQEMKNDLNAQPDFLSYSMVLQTWLLTKGGLDKAIALAREALDERIHGNIRTQPESRVVKSVILAFCRAGVPGKAEEILLEVCELAMQNILPKPDFNVFGAVVWSWERSKHPDAALRAEELIEKMTEMDRSRFLPKGPDFLTFKALLYCWMKSSADGAAKRAHALVMKIGSDAVRRGEKLALDIVSYNRVLVELTRENMPAEAEELLRQMHSDYLNQHGSTKPNIESYNIVLWAWARSESADSVEKVEALFRNMKDLDITCTTESYNAVLHCWSNSKRPEAADRISELLNEMNTQSDTGERSNPRR